MAGGKTKISAPQGKDIRGFFGGGPSSSLAASSRTTSSQSSTSKATDGTARARPILIDDEDDVKPLSKPQVSSSLRPTSAKIKTERVMDEDEDEIEKTKPTLKRKKHAILISSSDEETEKKASPPKKKHASTVISSSKATGSSFLANAKPTLTKPTPAKKKVAKDDYYEMSSEDVTDDNDDYEEEEEERKPTKNGKGKAKPTPKKTPAKPQPAKESKSKAKAADRDEDKPTADTKPKPKFNWAAAKAAKMAGPIAHGSKEVPTPASENCLAGLSLVFTGELSSFSRDEAVDLAKRYGGRVVGQPSSKTSYVVVGEDAGPSKLAAIKKNNLKTLNEDQFLELIRTRVPDESTLDEKTRKKIEKEKEAIRDVAKEMERREKQAAKKSAKAGSSIPDVSSQLWTDRYAPQTLKEICGNKGQVEKLQQWLHDWSASLKSGFKKPGKSGMNVFRAVLITGPPGIGKTTSAHLCAKLEGFTPIELNASDARSKKLVESSTNIMNASLDGWMVGGAATNAAGVAITDKSCLIMDEVDGMSAGDRGGVGALTALIKKTKIPIICIANDRGAMKLKPLANVTYNLTFRKPEANVIRSRILSIAFKENMKIPANVIDQLITGAQSDIRQVLNMLSTWRLSSDTMDFDEGKALAKANEKYSMMTPFNVVNKLLGPYLFSPTSRESLNDKIELYFHDHSFMPLFVQENYLKTQPSKLKHMAGPEQELKHLELMEKASASISDGDLVDALIHGSEQHWSLMPLHAVCSTVRPASFLFGMGAGWNGPMAMSFPQWLGQNSKQNKLSRQLTDVQARMRLKVSGDKPEIRISYIPAMHPHLVKPLIDKGSSAVDEVIDFMDEYFLMREDWDTIVELGVDQNRDEVVLKKISAATKTALTKKYNSKDHPIAFHRAADLGKVPKKIAAAGPLPDLEEAIDVDEEIEEAVEETDDKSTAEDDLARDSLIKAPKKAKGAAAARGKSAAATGKGKGRAKS